MKADTPVTDNLAQHPWPAQGRGMLATAVAAIVAVVLAIAAFRNTGGATTLAAIDDDRPALAANEFRPTPAQWANLQMTSIGMLPFHTEEFADGKIALNGDQVTQVFSPYSGRVTELVARLGDNVRKGAPLAAIAAAEFAQGQNDLRAAVGALNTAQSQLNLALANEQRKHDLYDVKAGSLQDWLQGQSDLTAARNSLHAAEATLGLARNRLRILGKSDTEVAALENAGVMDPVAMVAAPISGTVIDRQVGLGQFVQANAAIPLYSIGDLSTVWLVANVREADAPRIHRGAPVEVRVLALPDRVFKATVGYVASSVDPTTRRVAVRAEIQNPGGVLKPEMFASFRISSSSEASAPAVPESAIVYEGSRTRVWVGTPNGTLAARAIQVGRVSNGMVEVLHGLAAGEKVVTGGSLFIDRAAKGA